MLCAASEYCICMVFLYILSMATAQAPGDEDVFCSNMLTVQDTASTTYVKVLMDSYHYANLIPSTWQVVHKDGNVNTSVSVIDSIMRVSLSSVCID